MPETLTYVAPPDYGENQARPFLGRLLERLRPELPADIVIDYTRVTRPLTTSDVLRLFDAAINLRGFWNSITIICSDSEQAYHDSFEAARAFYDLPMRVVLARVPPTPGFIRLTD